MNPCLHSYRLSLLILSMLSSGSYAENTGTDEALSHEQAQRWMQAVGQIYLREQMTFQLLADCAGEFNHLSESADRARTNWQSTNNPSVKKANRIQDFVTHTIQSQQSDFEAVKFTLNIETLVHNSVSGFRSKLAEKSRKDRHYVCNRMILSISAGEWDLDQQIPEAISIVNTFKETD